MPQVKEKWCYTLTFSWLGRHFYPKKKQITSEEQAVLCVSNQPYVSLTGRKLVFEGEENCQEEAAHNKNKMQFLRLRTETRNKMKMNLRFDSEYLLCCRLCRVQPIQIRQLIFLWCRTIMFVCLLPLCCSYSGRGIVVVAQPDNRHTSHIIIYLSAMLFRGEYQLKCVLKSCNWILPQPLVQLLYSMTKVHILHFEVTCSRFRLPIWFHMCRLINCKGRRHHWIVISTQQQMLLNCWYVPELKQLICSAGLDTCRSLFFFPPLWNWVAYFLCCFSAPRGDVCFEHCNPLRLSQFQTLWCSVMSRVPQRSLQWVSYWQSGRSSLILTGLHPFGWRWRR